MLNQILIYGTGVDIHITYESWAIYDRNSFTFFEIVCLLLFSMRPRLSILWKIVNVLPLRCTIAPIPVLHIALVVQSIHPDLVETLRINTISPRETENACERRKRVNDLTILGPR